MAELNFSTYVDAIRPALMKHSGKQDAAIFLLNAVSEQKLGEEEEKKKSPAQDYTLPDGSSLNRVLRGVLPVPESIRHATAKPKVVESAADYFQNDVGQDLHPYLKDEVTEKLLSLIQGDYSIPEARRESLLALSQGNDYRRFLSETFIYAINRPINPNPEDGQQKISIPLLVFLFCFSITVFGMTMYTFIRMNEVSTSLIVFAFFFSVVLFILLIGFYFFLWRRDV